MQGLNFGSVLPTESLLKPSIMMLLTAKDKDHIGVWRTSFREKFSRAVVDYNTPITLAQVVTDAKKMGIKQIVTTSNYILKKLIVQTKATTNASEDEYSVYKFAGSVFQYMDCEFLIVPPFVQLRYPIDRFQFDFWFKKFYAPQEFHPDIPFTWEEAQPSRFHDLLKIARSCEFMAVDCETITKPLMANMWGFAMLIAKDGKPHIHSVVVHIDSMAKFDFARKMIRTENAQKIMHNGHYDCSYALLMNMAPMNFLWDTYGLMHAFYAELPRNLGFTSSIFVRNYMYWKDERKGNFSEKLLYNAKDCYNTLMAFLGMMNTDAVKDWVTNNYKQTFRMLYPALNADCFGIKVDLEERAKQDQKYYDSLVKRREKIRAWLGIPYFNPSSPDQVSALYYMMSRGKIKGSAKVETAKFRELGPIHNMLGKEIADFRKDVKALGTYFQFELLDDRLLYKFDPFGTATGRGSSQASDFWCGTQIQNQPGYAKSMYVADEGWEDAEIDNSQSESRTTAYLAQEERLIETVETSPDFHCTNSSLFFGIPFEQLYDVKTKKKLNKEVRDLGKRVNHGANYNMEAGKMVETMGEKYLYEAARMLGWPPIFTAKMIASLLLRRFEKIYPRVRGAFQDEIAAEITKTGRLVIPHFNWTRICLEWTTGTKEEINAYVAHKPQSASVLAVNEGYYESWRLYQYEEYLKHGVPRVRFQAQIHDSLKYQHRPGDDEVHQLISKAMAKPITFHGRTFVIPNDPKFGAKRWSDLKD